MASSNPIVLPQQIMLLQSLSYLEHDLAHDLHPGQGGKDKRDSKSGQFSGRMIQLRETKLNAYQIAFLKANRKTYDKPSAGLGGGRIQIGVRAAVRAAAARAAAARAAAARAAAARVAAARGVTEAELKTPQAREVFAASLVGNEEGFEDTVMLSLANRFIQEKSMWWTDIKRADGAVLHGFFIIWPIKLNKQGDQGKIYISNVDPNEVNVYNVTIHDYPGKFQGFPATIVEIQSPEKSAFSEVYGPSFYIIRQRAGLSDYQLILGSQSTAHSQGFVSPDPSKLYSKAAIESLYQQQGVLGNYLLDDILGFDMADQIGGRKKKTYVGGASLMNTEPAMKANLAYIICMAASSHRYAWNRVLNARDTAGVMTSDTGEKAAMMNAIDKERNMLSSMVKKAQDPGKNPGATGAGDIDKHLRSYVLDMIPQTDYTNSGEADFIYAAHKPWTGKNTFLSDIVNQDPTNGSKYVKLFTSLQNGQKKYYLSNAVPATHYLTTSGVTKEFSVTPHFCETSSIMDGQSTCNTITSAKTGDGAYIGDQVFTITDAASLGGDAPGSTAITYNLYIKVNPSPSAPNSCIICAHYKCGDTTLVDIGMPDEKVLPAWPKPSSQRVPGLNVSLTDADASPLNAVNCFAELCNVAIKLYKDKAMGFYDILQNLRASDDGAWANARIDVLNVSVRKSLGDVLQELSAASVNGGYFPGAQIFAPQKGGGTIAGPNEGRLMLSNDGPSGLRSVLYVLYGLAGINPNILTGYLHPASTPTATGNCKPATACSDFFVAGRTTMACSQEEVDATAKMAALALTGGGKYSKTNKKKKNTQKRKSKKDKKKNKKTKKKFF